MCAWPLAACLLFPLFWELPDRVDYGMLEQRYSPADVVEAVPKPMMGNPEKGMICTSHVERIRQRNYRVDKGGGLAYRRTAAQAVGVSPASL